MPRATDRFDLCRSKQMSLSETVRVSAGLISWRGSITEPILFRPQTMTKHCISSCSCSDCIQQVMHNQLQQLAVLNLLAADITRQVLPYFSRLLRHCMRTRPADERVVPIFVHPHRLLKEKKGFTSQIHALILLQFCQLILKCSIAHCVRPVTMVYVCVCMCVCTDNYFADKEQYIGDQPSELSLNWICTSRYSCYMQ